MKRYRQSLSGTTIPVPVMKEDPDGDWVHVEDVQAALEDILKTLTEEVLESDD